MNSVVLTGIVSGEIKTFTFEGGNSVTNFKVFASRGKNKDGTYKPGLNFKCQAWGKLGTEVIERFAKDKMKVLVSGEIEELKVWGKGENPGVDCVVTVRNFEMLDKTHAENGRSTSPEQSQEELPF